MLFCHDVYIVVHGFCVVDMVIGMVWLRIKDDSSSENSYSEIIWMIEDIVDKHSVTSDILLCGTIGPWVKIPKPSRKTPR